MHAAQMFLMLEGGRKSRLKICQIDRHGEQERLRFFIRGFPAFFGIIYEIICVFVWESLNVFPNSTTVCMTGYFKAYFAYLCELLYNVQT